MMIKKLEAKLDRARGGAIAALELMLDLKQLKTGQYAGQLSRWALRVAEHLGAEGEELWDIEVASLLYDIGKIGVPDDILLKPGKLSEEEYEQVKKHPEYGWGILRSIPGFERVSLIVLHHHERWDGEGYPAGLAGDRAPLGSRIVAVVDTLEAMLSDRPYRRGFSPGEVIRRLTPESGSQFDPEVMQQFMLVAGWNLPGMSSVGEPPSRGRTPQACRAMPGAEVAAAASWAPA